MASGTLSISNINIPNNTKWKLYKNPSNALAFNFGGNDKVTMNTDGTITSTTLNVPTVTTGSINKLCTDLLTKGDMYIGTGVGTVSKLQVLTATNGSALAADSNANVGMKWKVVSSNTASDHNSYTNNGGTGSHATIDTHLANSSIHVTVPISVRGDLWVRNKSGVSAALPRGANMYELRITNSNVTYGLTYQPLTATAYDKPVNGVSIYPSNTGTLAYNMIATWYPNIFWVDALTNFIRASEKILPQWYIQTAATTGMLFETMFNAKAGPILIMPYVPATMIYYGSKAGTSICGIYYFTVILSNASNLVYNYSKGGNLLRTSLEHPRKFSVSVPIAPPTLTLTAAPLAYTGTTDAGSNVAVCQCNIHCVLLVYLSNSNVLTYAVVNTFYNIIDAQGTISTLTANHVLIRSVAISGTSIGILYASSADGNLIYDTATITYSIGSTTGSAAPNYSTTTVAWSGAPITVASGVFATDHAQIKISQLILNNAGIPCAACINSAGDVMLYTQGSPWTATQLYSAGTYSSPNQMSVLIGYHGGYLMVASYLGSGTSLLYKKCQDNTTGTTWGLYGGQTTATLNTSYTGGAINETIGQDTNPTSEFTFVANMTGKVGIYGIDMETGDVYVRTYFSTDNILGIRFSYASSPANINNNVIYVTGQSLSSTSGRFSPNSILLYRDRNKDLKNKIVFDLFNESNSMLASLTTKYIISQVWLWSRLIVFRFTSGSTSFRFADEANISI